jgi:hypothetical protein
MTISLKGIIIGSLASLGGLIVVESIGASLALAGVGIFLCVGGLVMIALITKNTN